jgi:KUP system potassium uptake protein
MAFWTWARVFFCLLCVWNINDICTQRLEDQFDGDNRRNLRHFIMTEDDGQVTFSLRAADGPSASVNDLDQETVKEPTYHYIARDSEKMSVDGVQEKEERRELVRISTCAVFYKMASGKGVPHSFVGKSNPCGLVVAIPY